MVAFDPARRELARRFFEHWGVPLDEIARFGRYLPKTMNEAAKRDGWQRRRSAASLRGRVAGIIERCLTAAENGETDPAQADRDAKAAAVLVKTLETLAAFDRSEPMDGVHGNDEDAFSAGLTGGPDAIRELDRRLAGLLGDAAQAGAAR